MSRYDSDPDAAERELRKASDEVDRIDADLTNAREMYDDFERQWNEAESEADKEHLWSVMNVVDNEILGLMDDLKEAEENLGRENDYWFDD